MGATPVTEISTLASGIIEYSLDGITDYAPFLYVSGWLNTNIGKLNNSIYTSFYTETGAFMPSGLLPEEQAIYTSLFMQHYYKKIGRSVLLGVSTATGASDFIMIKEGDSVVQRSSKQQISRTYNDMAAAEKEECDRLIFQYQLNAASPSQVAGEDGDDPLLYSTPPVTY